jgi:transcriptional regulator with XRE-family HTH domain
MNPKTIGLFLRQLRNEKKLTQEQIAEVLGVSGRTVSRWETGINLPDLSILVQISEYYEVEIKEILNGERKSENMDKELKETLLNVADYTEMGHGNMEGRTMRKKIFSLVFYVREFSVLYIIFQSELRLIQYPLWLEQFVFLLFLHWYRMEIGIHDRTNLFLAEWDVLLLYLVYIN